MHPAPARRSDPDALCALVSQFVADARQPILLDPGEEPLPVTHHNFAINPRGSVAILECWTDTRNLVRRVRRIVDQRRGRLELEVERFGSRTGTILLLDRAEPSTQAATRHGIRLEYRERFRVALRRQFPDWKLGELSTEPDLQHSLSPSYPRAFLRKGNAAFAAIGASENSLDPAGVLSFGLIWLDHLRQREKKLGVEGLAIFLPAGLENTTCHRVRHLNPDAARYAVFVTTPDGFEDPVEPRDYTNLSTHLESFRRPLLHTGPDLAARIADLSTVVGVEQRPRPDGSISLAVRGLEFARISDSSLLYGLESPQVARDPRHFREIESLALGLSRLRRADAPDRSNPLYARHSEAWLESQVRANLETIDATLQPAPVYTQAPVLSGGDRGIIDLLAVDRRGRLTVLEIKAAEDIQLPMQALDYWMHIKWHLDRDEFSQNGYFPGVVLSPEPPRLILVSPALDYHPTNEAVLRYLSPEVSTERVGVGLEWRKELRVMFRAPASPWPSKSFGK